VPRLLVRPVERFMRQEAAGGIVLAAATVAALLWANLDPGSYASLWDTAVTLEVGGRVVEEDLLHVVNDGLMTLFFLVIGLEVKRELTVGELRDPKAASLPFFAALGGMVVPALIFLALTAGGEGGDGWGIPIATDVAFALAALAALGSRVPTALVAFLLGIAVIDDIGAIAVIAIFYTDALHLAWLAAAGAGLVAVAALNRIHVRSTTVYVVLGIAIWFATFESGVHATLAGVALGLLTPARPFQRPAAVGAEAAEVSRGVLERPDDDETDAGRMRRLSWLSKEAISPLDRVEHALHRWSSFVVLPIFALANAGIALDRDGLDAVTANGVAAGVAAGLVVGKLIGVTGGTLLAVRLGVGRLPRDVGWSHVLGIGGLAGIGFTVSLFIAGLSYPEDPALETAARLGILGGSAAAAILGVALLLAATRRPDRPADGPTGP
jgi:NhaA family Na+:H+ antiporter